MESGDGVRRGVGRGRRVVGWEYRGGREKATAEFIRGELSQGDLLRGKLSKGQVITRELSQIKFRDRGIGDSTSEHGEEWASEGRQGC